MLTGLWMALTFLCTLVTSLSCTARTDDALMQTRCDVKCKQGECPSFCVCEVDKQTDGGSCSHPDNLTQRVYTVAETAPPNSTILTFPVVGKEAWQLEVGRGQSGVDQSLRSVFWDYFSMTQAGGRFRLAVRRTPDLEEILEKYKLEVSKVPLTLTCSFQSQTDESHQLALEIASVNEFAPSFMQNFDISVPEDRAVGSELLTLSHYTIDKDVNTATSEIDLFSLWNYTRDTQDGQKFIGLSDRRTGRLTLTQELDYESLKVASKVTMFLNVSARDVHGNETFTTVKVTVTDMDDLPPEFTDPGCPVVEVKVKPCLVSYRARTELEYVGEVMDISPERITAFDLDTLSFSILYSLERGPSQAKELSDKFTINQTGSLHVVSAFFAPAQVNLVVVATENSSKARTTQAPLSVTVTSPLAPHLGRLDTPTDVTTVNTTATTTSQTTNTSGVAVVGGDGTPDPPPLGAVESPLDMSGEMDETTKYIVFSVGAGLVLVLTIAMVFCCKWYASTKARVHPGTTSDGQVYRPQPGQGLHAQRSSAELEIQRQLSMFSAQGLKENGVSIQPNSQMSLASNIPPNSQVSVASNITRKSQVSIAPNTKSRSEAQVLMLRDVSKGRPNDAEILIIDSSAAGICQISSHATQDIDTFIQQSKVGDLMTLHPENNFQNDVLDCSSRTGVPSRRLEAFSLSEDDLMSSADQTIEEISRDHLLGSESVCTRMTPITRSESLLPCNKISVNDRTFTPQNDEIEKPENAGTLLKGKSMPKIVLECASSSSEFSSNRDSRSFCSKTYRVLEESSEAEPSDRRDEKSKVNISPDGRPSTVQTSGDMRPVYSPGVNERAATSACVIRPLALMRMKRLYRQPYVLLREQQVVRPQRQQLEISQNRYSSGIGYMVQQVPLLSEESLAPIVLQRRDVGLSSGQEDTIMSEMDKQQKPQSQQHQQSKIPVRQQSQPSQADQQFHQSPHQHDS